MHKPYPKEKLLGSGMAFLIFAALCLWLAGGSVNSQPEQPTKLRPAAQSKALTPVTTLAPVTRQLSPRLRVYGETFAQRQVTLRAQRQGTIEKLQAQLGAQVAAQQVLAQIHPEDLNAQYQAAEAELARQKSEYDAAKRLNAQNLVGQTRLNETRAAFAHAKAQVAQIENELKLRQITAPFSGVIDEDFVEIGDFVQVGAPLFRLVDLSDIQISAEIAAADLPNVFLGQPVQITLDIEQPAPATHGQNAKQRPQLAKIGAGKVTHISKVPQPNTRTYRIEVSMNAKGNHPPLALGIGATLDLISPEIPAYLISPALLSLNDTGQMGVKTVSEAQVVQFQPVQIIKADREGIWVSGLSPQIPVISVGQGYVRIGEKVDVTAQHDASVKQKIK